MLLFMGFFYLIHFIESWRFELNLWVVDVKDMDGGFNPMGTTWLFYHDHKKWTQWCTIMSLIFAVSFGTLFGWVFVFILSASPIILGNLWTSFSVGWTIAMMLMVLFAFSWYKYYTSVDRTPFPYPRGRLSDLPRRL